MEWEYSNYSNVDAKVKDAFPFSSARENQLETISEVKHAIEKGYKYIVLEAGTGTGKSAIAATLASIYDSTYILTVTKQLQDQYLRDFKNLGFRLVKGRGNFTCRKYQDDNINQFCDEGRCILEGYKCEYSIKNNHDGRISREGTCHYDYQKYLGLISPVVISNYHYLFLELNFVGDFRKRELMIFDEAHKLEESIMSLLKLEFDRKELKEHANINLSKSVVRKLNNGDYKDWISFINRVKDIYLEEYNKIKDIKNRPELNTKRLYLKKRIDDCYIFTRHIRHDPDKWIFDYDSHWGVAQFKPVKVDKYAKDTFLQYGNVCIFMSATILDYKLFAKWLGIDVDEIYAIRQKSPFEISRNPIKTFKGFNMSYNNLEDSAPSTIPLINDILEKHKDDKGIIHTVSYNCKNYLKRKIDNPRLIDHKTHNRAKRLKMFRKSDNPLVLISPSMNEGVDLPGDLCRFQIIYKLPYPNVMDKQTSLRMRMDREWFKYKTSLALVQTVGRGMRYEDDYCRTYFIDSRLKGFVLMDKLSDHFLPDTFTEAIDIEPAKIDDKKKQIVKKVEIEKENDSDNLYDKIMAIEPSGRFKVERAIDEVKSYRNKVNFKYKLILKGKKLTGNEAIEFYNDLLDNELFENDYHPYLKLMELYDSSNDYAKETHIISRFLRSGIFARKSIIKKFIKRLTLLSRIGHIEYSKVKELEDEYSKNGKLNKNALPKFPVSYYLFKTNKNLNRKENPFNPESFGQVCENASKDGLVNVGDRLLAMQEHERAIAFYESLLSHPFFANDSYIYHQLAVAYHKNHKYNDEVDVMVEFYKSGIQCDEKQLKWFKKQLRKTAKYGNFDYSLMNSLEYEHENGVSTVDFKSSNHIKVKKVSNDDLIYTREYFNDLARKIAEKPGFVSDRELLEHEEDEFVEVIHNYAEINEKADLKNHGKELEKDDKQKAIDFYDELKCNDLFKYDYYPYRRQCILFKNRIKNDQRDWDTIIELLKNPIYLNKYQLIWIKNKIYELIGKLELDNDEISKVIELIDKYNENENQYKKLQDKALPIAERIFKQEGDLKLLSYEKYEKMQGIFYVKELGVGYIRRRDYESAMKYYAYLLKSDFLYYRYHAFKQIGRIASEMNDDKEFKKLHDLFLS